MKGFLFGIILGLGVGVHLRQRGWSKRLTLAYYQTKEEKEEYKKKEELNELRFHAKEGNINSVEYANFLKGRRVETSDDKRLESIYEKFEESLKKNN